MPEEELGRKKIKRRKSLLIASACIAALLITSAGIWLFISSYAQKSIALPSTVTEKIDFIVLYPDELPKRYRLDKESAKVENNMLFFDLTKDGQVIHITEQPLPELGDIVLAQRDFSKVELRRGKAYVGTSGERPVVLMSIDKTLISITGGAGVAKDTVVDLAEHMKTLE